MPFMIILSSEQTIYTFEILLLLFQQWNILIIVGIMLIHSKVVVLVLASRPQNIYLTIKSAFWFPNCLQVLNQRKSQKIRHNDI